jgi:antitoxin VapB
MATARVFKSGNSQAVRLPKEFRFDVDEVEIIQQGNTLILRKPKLTYGDILKNLPMLPADFEWERPADPPPSPVTEWAAELSSASRKPKRTATTASKPVLKRLSRKKV